MAKALAAARSGFRRFFSISAFTPPPAVAPPPKADPSTNLFVSGLSKRTTSEGLREAFSKFGEIIQAKVVTDRVSGYSKGFGFVRYTSIDEASEGIKGMDGKFLDGWVIFAEYARPKLPPQDQQAQPQFNYGGSAQQTNYSGYSPQSAQPPSNNYYNSPQTSQPQQNYGSSVPWDFASQIPPVNYSSQMPQSNYQSNYPSQMPQSNYTPQTPQSTYSSQMPQSNYSSQMPQSNYSSQMPQSNYPSQMPPVNYSSQTPAANFSSQLPPANFLSEMHPANYSSQMPPTNFSSQIPPAASNYESVPPRSGYDSSYFGHSSQASQPPKNGLAPQNNSSSEMSQSTSNLPGNAPFWPSDHTNTQSHNESAQQYQTNTQNLDPAPSGYTSPRNSELESSSSYPSELRSDYEQVRAANY